MAKIVEEARIILKMVFADKATIARKAIFNLKMKYAE